MSMAWHAEAAAAQAAAAELVGSPTTKSTEQLPHSKLVYRSQQLDPNSCGSKPPLRLR